MSLTASLWLFEKYKKKHKIFIETGSFLGGGIELAILAGFEKIYSIELSEKYYNICKEKFKENKNVEIIFGDSLKELPKLLENIMEPCLFWLDGHYFGFTSEAFGGDSARGEFESPLLYELDAIKNHKIKNHSILIDDIFHWEKDEFKEFKYKDIEKKILEIDINYKINLEDGGRKSDILAASCLEIENSGHTTDKDIIKDVIQDNIYCLPNEINNYNIIDIGSHVGCFSKMCLNRGAKKVASFEPNKKNYTYLERNLKEYKNSLFFNLCVWGEGKRKLKFKEYEYNTGGGECLSGDGDYFVETISLDEIIEKYFFNEKIDFLKIDCEGSEYDIFYNSKNIRKIDNISGEYHIYDNSSDDLKTIKKLKDFFEENGYIFNYKRTGHDSSKGIEIGLFFAKKIKIRVTAMCKNEEKILPFFLDHYSSFCDKIEIYDGNSEDSTSEIIKKYPKAEMKRHNDDDGEKLDDILLTKMRNEVWKEGRDIYDWQIVCDVDEFLYGENILKELVRLKKIDVTIPRISGYDMISLEEPKKEFSIFSQIKKGNFSNLYSKNIIFNPKQVDINYGIGCHVCFPSGETVFGDSDLILLHYQKLSYEYLKNKYKYVESRLSESNRRYGYGKYQIDAYTNLEKNKYLEMFNNSENIFDKFSENKISKRWQLINHVIKKCKYKKYLEIGCFVNENFDKIICEKKVGVDPESGGTIKKTSDEFFKDNIEKFDIIFIDGLHISDQALRDIENSLKVLNAEGIIVVHDCLPTNEEHQVIPENKQYPGGDWTGDVWKAFFQIRKMQDIDACVFNIDWGCGLIKKRKNTKILNKNIDINWISFIENKKEMMNIKNNIFEINSWIENKKEYDLKNFWSTNKNNEKIQDNRLIKNLSVVVMTSINLRERYCSCHNTWSKQIEDVFFIAGEESYEDNRLICLSGVGEDWNSAFLKQMFGLKIAYEKNKEKSDWYFVCGCDTFLNVNNIKKLLSNYNSNEEIFLGGCALNFDRLYIRETNCKFYPSGGSGFFISKKLMEKFYPRIEEFVEIWGEVYNKEFDINTPYAAGDLAISYFLWKYFNIQLTIVPTGFCGFRRDDYIDLVKDCYSIHYISPKEMHECYEFANKHPKGKYSIFYAEHHFDQLKDYANLCSRCDVDLYLPKRGTEIFRASSWRAAVEKHWDNNIYVLENKEDIINKIKTGFFDFIMISEPFELDELVQILGEEIKNQKIIHNIGSSTKDYLEWVRDSFPNAIICSSKRIINNSKLKFGFHQRKLPNVKFEKLSLDNSGFYCYINSFKDLFPYSYEKFQKLKTLLPEEIIVKDFGVKSENGFVNDEQTMKSSIATIHIKDRGAVCNSVAKSIALGVPVIMDRESYEKGYYDSYDHILIGETVEEVAEIVKNLYYNIEYRKEIYKTFEDKRFLCEYTDDYGKQFLEYLKRLKEYKAVEKKVKIKTVPQKIEKNPMIIGQNRSRQ